MTALEMKAAFGRLLRPFILAALAAFSLLACAAPKVAPPALDATIRYRNGLERRVTVISFGRESLLVEESGTRYDISTGKLAGIFFTPLPGGPHLKEIRSISVPGIGGYSGALMDDWNRDGRPDIHLVRDGRLVVVSLDGSILMDRHIGPVKLDLVASVGGSGPYKLVTSRTEGRDMVISVLDRDLRELKRFTVEGTLHEGVMDSSITARVVCDFDGDGRREVLATVDTGAGRSPRGLYCFDYEDGSLRWRHLTGPAVKGLIPLRVRGILEFLLMGSSAPGNGNDSEDGTDDARSWLYALSPQGQVRWITPAGGSLTRVDLYIGHGPGNMAIYPVGVVQAINGSKDQSASIISFNEKGTITARYDAGPAVNIFPPSGIRNDGRVETVALDRRGLITILDEGLDLLMQKKIGWVPPDGIDGRSIVVDDLDGDGKKEIIITWSERKCQPGDSSASGDDGRSCVWRNNKIMVLRSDLSLAAEAVVAAEWREFPGFDVSVLDVDGDHEPEIVCLADKITVYKFIGDTTPKDAR